MSGLRSRFMIGVCVFGALVLEAFRIPGDLPEVLAWARPEWLVLVVFYWTIALPHRTGVLAAWCAGLLQDAITAAPLGLNAFCMALVGFIALSGYERMRMYSLVQQALILALVLAGIEGIRVAESVLAGPAEFTLLAWLPVLTTAPLWIPAFLVQRALRRQLALS